MTFSNRLYPHSSFFSMGKMSYPVARMTVPTLTLTNSSLDLEVDCMLLGTAGSHAEAALDTGVEVDGVDQGDDLRVVDVDCLPWFHAHFELVGLDNRTDCFTVTAAVAAAADNAVCFCFCRGEDTACLLADGDIEVTDVPFDFIDFRVGNKLDIRAPCRHPPSWGLRYTANSRESGRSCRAGTCVRRYWCRLR